MKQFLMLTCLLLTFSVGFASCGSDDSPVVPDSESPVNPSIPGDNDDNDASEDEGNGQVPDDNGNPNHPEDGEDPDRPGDEGNENNNENMSNKLRITVGSVLFTATLEDHAAARAFKALLPMTIHMSELNGNEKYYYLPEGLPTAASNPRTIRTGDLMLFGSTCLVLFYESFSTSYSYTRLGRVDNSSELASALGRGNVTVRFELQ